MRPSTLPAILVVTNLLTFASAAIIGDDAPQMTDISQRAAKPGDIITVSGLGLSAKNVDEIYLTDHKFDMRVKVLEQTDKAVKFRVPPFAKPGRMQMLFLSKGDQPKLLEQPVYLLIEDADAEIVVATAKASPGPEPAKPEAAAPPAKSDEKPEAAKTEAIKTEATKPESTKENNNTKPEIRQPEPHK